MANSTRPSSHRCWGEQHETVQPQMLDPGAAQDDAPRDVDVIGRRNQVADGVEDSGHRLSRKDVAGKEDARQKRDECELNRLGLGISLT